MKRQIPTFMRFVLLGCVTLPGLTADSGLAVLSNVRQVRALPPEQAKLGYPVHIRAVVTFANPKGGELFVQDGTAGIYVKRPENEVDVQPGQLVDLIGVSAPGDFAPVIEKRRLQVIGRSPLPQPRLVDFQQLSGGREDSQYIEVRGVVHAASVLRREGKELVALQIDLGDGAMSVWYPASSPSNLEHWVNSTVRVRGVCASEFNEHGQFLGSMLWVGDLNEIQIVSPAPADPFDIPLHAIHRMLGFSPREDPRRRIKIRGVVTYCNAKRTLAIQDGDQGTYVETAQPSQLALGTVVEAVGFSTAGEYAPVLQNALVRVMGRGQAPAPAVVTAKQILEGNHDSLVVRMRARVLERVHRAHEQLLVLQQGDSVFNAELETSDRADDLAKADNGSLVDLTGVCSVQTDETRAPRSFRIMLRSPLDLRVVQTPPWWTRERTFRVAALSTTLVCLAGIWVLLLRRRVRQQTSVIHEQLASEAALRQRYYDLFENASDMVYSRDLSGRFLSINRAGEKILEYSREEVLALNVLELMAPEDPSKTGELPRQAVSEDHPGTFEKEIITKSGKRVTLEVSLRLTHKDGKPSRFDGIARDVTMRKQAQLELRRAMEAAESASRAKSDFLANMSHEIRTPMYGVLGMTDLALETDLTEQQRGYLSIAKTSGESLLKIIDDILDLSKIEAGKLKMETVEFKLRESLSATLGALAHRAHAKGLELACEIDPDVPDGLSGDPGRLRQIILNLVANAIKFTEHGEVVLSVAVENLKKEPTACRLHFTVRDTGIGIPLEKQTTVFEPFSQADETTTRRFGGTGLGLTISAQLASLMGGTIWLSSEPGAGTNVHVTAKFGICAIRDREADELALVRAERLEVLVVDDNATSRCILCGLLGNWNIRATLTGNAREALRAIEERRDTFDLLLVDSQMPEMGGLGLADEFRRRYPNSKCKVVVLWSPGARGAAGPNVPGIDASLTKPVRSSELLSVIRRLTCTWNTDVYYAPIPPEPVSYFSGE